MNLNLACDIKLSGWGNGTWGLRQKKKLIQYTPSPLHQICDHYIPLFDEASQANLGKAGQGIVWDSFLWWQAFEF